jgi:hypothetical protein
MFTTPFTQQVQWQDLVVQSELDMVLDLARGKGWGDIEIFGHGEMITQIQEINGWKLIPADLYEYSIPPEAIARLLQLIQAGVHLQGVIIADDTHAAAPAPARLIRVLPTRASIGAWTAKTAKALAGLAGLAGVIVEKAAIVLLALAFCAAMGGLLLFILPVAILFLFGAEYDPKLIVLVEDGHGGTAWVSLFTWYESSEPSK